MGKLKKRNKIVLFLRLRPNLVYPLDFNFIFLGVTISPADAPVAQLDRALPS